MGVELVLGVLSLAVGVVGGIAQAGAAQQAVNAQKESNAIAAAQTTTNSIENTRQRVREERVRRAQIIAAAENQGTTASSGESGALGSLGSNFGTLVSNAAGNSNANSGINASNQKAADATAQSNMIGSMTNLAQSSIKTFGTIFH